MADWFSSCSPIQPMTGDSGTCWSTLLVSSHPGPCQGECPEVEELWKLCFVSKLLAVQITFFITVVTTEYLTPNYTNTRDNIWELLTFNCCFTLPFLPLKQKSMVLFQRNASQSHTAQRPPAEWTTSSIIRWLYTHLAKYCLPMDHGISEKSWHLNERWKFGSCKAYIYNTLNLHYVTFSWKNVASLHNAALDDYSSWLAV